MNTFASIITEPALPETSAARPNVSGIEFQPIDVEKALWLLDQLDAFDPIEQRETFEFLRQALNEDRAAAGERLVFS
jgi:hypothetical protein